MTTESEMLDILNREARQGREAQPALAVLRRYLDLRKLELVEAWLMGEVSESELIASRVRYMEAEKMATYLSGVVQGGALAESQLEQEN